MGLGSRPLPDHPEIVALNELQFRGNLIVDEQRSDAGSDLDPAPDVYDVPRPVDTASYPAVDYHSTG